MEKDRTLDETTLAAFLDEGCLVLGDDGKAWIGWGAFRKAVGPEKGCLSIYAPDFFLRDVRPWRVYERSAWVGVEELVENLALLGCPPPPTPPPLTSHKGGGEFETSPFSEFAASFEDIQRRLVNGSLTKAVPFIARRARIEFDARERAALVLNALRRCRGSSLRAYGIWNAEGGMVGMTPETLFEEVAGDPPSLRTMALAGTRTPDAPSLLDDPKETHEHRVVVEGIAESLAPLGRVVVGRTEELRLPALVHLHTPIEVFPDRRVSFDEWVAALHPTAAIGAWPKAAGWRWLQDQPNAGERGRYGAPFGVVPPDATVGTCLVAIRNLQWTGDRARLLAGCGIVPDSRVEREWRELNAKLDSVQGALGL